MVKLELHQPWAVVKSYPSFPPTRLREFTSFALVGFAQNSVGYLVYLLLTWLGAEPKLTVAIAYPLGVLLSYLGNKKITFRHQGGNAGAFFRFVLIYALGYCLNLAGLWLFYDVLGYPHQWVQLGLMVFLACCFFLLQKFFVFPETKEREHETVS